MNKIKFGFVILGLVFLPVWIILGWWFWADQHSKVLQDLGDVSSLGEKLRVGDRLNIDLDGKVVCSKTKCWKVELATNPIQWKKGLQGVSFLASRSGMLFVFPVQKERGFWMSGMMIPLDIIWIDQKGFVTKIWRGAQPCKVAPCEIKRGFGKYVLEVWHKQ